MDREEIERDIVERSIKKNTYLHNLKDIHEAIVTPFFFFI